MRTITFRKIFICIALLLVANICVNLFTAAAKPEPVTVSTPIEHDGVCTCDGLDPNCTLLNTPTLDETAKMLKDFQLDIQYNGDIVIYALEGNQQVYVGVWKHGTKCDIVSMIESYYEIND